MGTTLTDPIASAWRTAWAPPDRRKNYEWATGEVVLAGDYAKTGKFSVGDSQYLVFPFDCLDNDVVRMINILKAPRTGGSLVGDIWLQDIFHNKPGPTLVNMQTDDDAERHYLTKTKPTFEATKANAALFAQLQKKRDLYQFPHMNWSFQGANMNSLQSKPAKYEWNDEVWIWKPGMMNQAFSRTEDFKRVCKILNISQGGNVNSEWELVFNAGRRYNYGVRCFGCGKLQPFEFFASMVSDPNERAGVVWDRTARTKDGRWDITRAAETTRFRCCHCGHEHTDEFRTYEKFSASADYLCLDPDRRWTDVSLRWNALVGGDWWRLVKKFIQACEVRDNTGSTQSLEDFYKKELATFWDPSLAQQKIHLFTTKEIAMEPVWSKGYKATKLEWESNRFIVADYQAGTGNDTRHLLVVARAWADESRNRSRLLWWGRVNGFSKLYELQLALGVRPACVGVDGGFEMMEVAAQCAKYGWTMLIGDDAELFLHKRKNAKPVRRPFSPLFKTDPYKGKTGAGKSYCWSMFWSNPAIKGLLWNLRHGLTRHKWEIPADIPVEYRDGIDSEVKKWVCKKGSSVLVPTWVPIKAYNHPWDDECMQAVLAVAAGCLSFDIEEDQQPDATDDRAAVAARAERKGGEPTAPHDKPDQLELLPS
jgi:hypothetical protein